MYWVDGVVFKRKMLKKAENFMLYAAIKYNFEFKEVWVNKIEVKHNPGGRLCIYVHKTEGKKEFMFPLNKK
jgi:hypothetical protein